MPRARQPSFLDVEFVCQKNKHPLAAVTVPSDLALLTTVGTSKVDQLVIAHGCAPSTTKVPEGAGRDDVSGRNREAGYDEKPVVDRNVA